MEFASVTFISLLSSGKLRNTDYFLQGMLLMLHVVPILLVLFIEVLLT